MKGGRGEERLLSNNGVLVKRCRNEEKVHTEPLLSTDSLDGKKEAGESIWWFGGGFRAEREVK